MATTTTEYERIAAAAAQRRTGRLDAWTLAYLTKGGTYMIASAAAGNDDDRPHDLIAVLLDGTVLVLRPTVNPDLFEAVAEAVQA